ncbi:MAG: c-type cytochrome, partial [Planctomycetaceae bacterium]|nr:c-type cytochrome [Planctomycetaceae bacterium]
GNLFVTSWGDHRIDRFVLKEKGASFESIAEPFITGGENFRPVGIALAPDGSMYCTDWVLRDYKLHGQGRVWRISCRSDSTAKQDGSQLASKNLGNRRLAAKKMAESANGRYELEQTLNDDKYPVRARIEALWAIAQIPKSVKDFRYLKTENDRRVAGAFDEVGVAFHHLGNEPQFHINRDPKLIPFRTNLVVTDRPLSNYPVASLAEYIVSELECCPEDDLFRFVEEALTRSDDPFVTHRLREVFRYADPNLPVEQIADSLQQEQFASESATEEVDARMATMFYLSLTDQGFRENEFVRIGLRSKWPTVRRIAVQWAAEQFSHTDLRPDVEAVLRSEPMTPDLFLATLAALDMLDGNPPAEFEKADVSKYIVPLLNDESTPDSVKVHGLRLLQPDAVKEHSDLIATLAKSDDQELTLEAVRTLALVDRWQAIDLARSQFQFRNPYAQASEHAIWLEYITLLGGVDPQTPRGDEARDNLVNQLIHRPDNKPPTLALDTRSASVIVRSLRGWQGDPQVQQAITAYHNAIGLFAVAHGSGPNEIWQQTILAWGEEPYPESFQKSVSFHQGIPQTDDTWETFLSESRPEDGTLGGAAQRGRTVFEHPNGPGCSKCHTVHGRGGNIGPDLSRIGATFTREKLIDSILNPSKEVSPQFTNWNMATSDGKVHTGMIVHENKGVTILGQPDGTTVTLDTIDIEVRSPQRTSVMPEKLEERMTVAEFRDLLEYLQSLE